MGVIQGKLGSVKIIVLFLLVFSLASSVLAEITVPDIPNGEGACCIPDYSGEVDFTVNQVASADQQAYCDGQQSTYVEQCYANGAITNPNFVAAGCCCTGFGTFYSGVVGTGDYVVSKLYCDSQAGTFLGEQANCNAACDSGTEYIPVEGVVENPVTNEPLSGIVISSNGQTATTNANGEFFFTEFFEEGPYNFEVDAPANYPLICPTDFSINRQVEIIGNQDSFVIYINFACEEPTVDIEPACTPDWQVQVDGEWVPLDEAVNGGFGIGEEGCLFYGTSTGWLKNRVLQDANNCPNPDDIPDHYTSEGCEDLSVTNTCDGTYDDGEICDGNSFFYQNTLYPAGLSCAQVYGDGYTGQVNCNSCFFDFSECQSPCDCSTVDQCSNECQFICEDEPICETCENALSFIPDGAPLSGDIFGLYEFIETTNPEGFPNSPVQFVLGTKDVILDWEYAGAEECTADVLGFDIMVCREDAGSGSCDTNYPIHYESINGISETQYTFTNVLEPEASYCFNVIARTNAGTYPAFEDGDYPCYDTGHVMCMTPQLEGRNCIYHDGSDGVEGYGPTACETYSQNDPRVNLQTVTEGCLDTQVCIETNYVPGSSSPEETGAMCVTREVCESCNGMFGLFASYNLPILESDGAQTPWTCQDIVFNVNEDNIKIPGSDATSLKYAQCYEEESDALFSFYNECETITSCYDYVSKGTCSNDPCFKFSDVEVNNNGVITNINGINCEWVDQNDELNIDFREIGLGVCRPVAVENQNCEVCDTNSSLGFCSKDLCPLYGDCFQIENAAAYQEEAFPFRDRVDQVPACVNADEMSCILYDTIEECIGPANINQSTPEVNVRYTDDAIAQGLEGIYLLPTDRIAGNNRQTNYSNDLFGFGDCQWNYDQNRCFKNSNNYVGVPPVDDCDNSLSSSNNCFKDTTPPLTEIYLKENAPGLSYPIYGSQEIFDIQFGTQDDFSTPEEIDTYVSFLKPTCQDQGYIPCGVFRNLGVANNNILQAGGNNQNTFNLNPPETCIDADANLSLIQEAYDNGCYIYPQYTLEQLEAEPEVLNSMLVGQNAVYDVLFFSEDKARNLERIKRSRISIDNTNPDVVIGEIQETVTQVYEDIYLTDVVIPIEVYEESYCQAYVTNIGLDNEVMSPGLIAFAATPTGNQPHIQTLSYPQMDDGLYHVFVECIDQTQNAGSAEEEFLLDADASITPVFPLGQVFSDPSEIELEINTAYDGTCRFDINNDEFTTAGYDFDTSIPENGRYTFTALYPSENLGSLSGLYRLLLSCSFETGSVTEGQPGDVLVFTIDQIPPTGSILEYGDVYDGNAASWRNSREVEVSCTDENEQLPPGFNMGCFEIHYCISTSSSLPGFADTPSTVCTGQGNEYSIVGQTDEEESDLLSPVISLDLSYQYTYIHYFFVDAGGATSQVFTQDLKIRDTETSIPAFVEIG